MTKSIDIEDIKHLRATISDNIILTPVIRFKALERLFSKNTKIYTKLEFLQKTGTFKIRGALTSLIKLDSTQKKYGVCAVSAGNHAIAVAQASKILGIDSKVVMPHKSNKFRVLCCKNLGAEVVFAKDSEHAFELVNEISQKENRKLIHPFEGQDIIDGTATLGYEILTQIKNFDSVVIPIGGGGLCAGVSAVIKSYKPSISTIGVEPEGAPSISMSIKCNHTIKLKKTNTIADSLAAPFSLPLSFQYCRDNLDDCLSVSEDQIKDAMTFLYNEMKIASEPACAVSTAAMINPLRRKLEGKTTVIIMCGSNIDWKSYSNLLQ